ncbi:thymidylate synthase [Xanthomonas phage JGB6]|nr:thymidylate synthase [Xanthomonas phage JGB6]
MLPGANKDIQLSIAPLIEKAIAEWNSECREAYELGLFDVSLEAWIAKSITEGLAKWVVPAPYISRNVIYDAVQEIDRLAYEVSPHGFGIPDDRYEEAIDIIAKKIESDSMNKTYEEALRHVYENGMESSDRTGTGTRRVFGLQYRFDLAREFPLITSKQVHWKSVKGELLWLLSGSTNNNGLLERGVTIWSEWADEDGELGLIYGKQWRDWESTTVTRWVWASGFRHSTLTKSSGLWMKLRSTRHHVG